MHIQTCLLTPNRAIVKARDLGQRVYRRLADDDLREAKFEDGSSELDAAPTGLATEGSL